MKPFTWRGIDYLQVAPLEPKRCAGCMFAKTVADECPHTDAGVDFICDANNDVIFIEDTEDAMVAYIAKKLEGA